MASSAHLAPAAGVAFTLALLIAAWASRGRLHSFGFEFLRWNRTSPRESIEALAFGAACGLCVSLLLRHLYHGSSFTWQEAWIGITLGPLLEEAAFRGYLFSASEWALRSRIAHASWVSGVSIAAVFALCHLLKPGITVLQIGVIFIMGLVYAWLRIKSGSTTSPFLAHAAYNIVIYAAAALLA